MDRRAATESVFRLIVSSSRAITEEQIATELGMAPLIAETSCVAAAAEFHRAGIRDDQSCQFGNAKIRVEGAGLPHEARRGSLTTSGASDPLAKGGRRVWALTLRPEGKTIRTRRRAAGSRRGTPPTPSRATVLANSVERHREPWQLPYGEGPRLRSGRLSIR